MTQKLLNSDSVCTCFTLGSRAMPCKFIKLDMQSIASRLMPGFESFVTLRASLTRSKAPVERILRCASGSSYKKWTI